MPTEILSPSLTTLRSPSNLLYHLSGLHPDGLHRARQPMATPDSSRASYIAEKQCNPRWGLDYVIATIAQSWEMVSETKTLTQERHFLPVLKNWVSMPSIG